MSRYSVFDSHCDTAFELWRRSQSIDQTDCHVSLSQMQGLAECSMFFAFCTYAGVDLGFSCEQLLWQPYQYFMKNFEQCGDAMKLCTSSEEQSKALNENKTAVFLSLEGAEGISCDPGRLEELKAAGFTMVNLTWNADNVLAGSAAKDGPGLSKVGRDFVKKAQKLGMVIDVSHISDKAFWDIMDITQAPIVASHSNSRKLCGHCRNLTDEQFLAICKTGGYVGINLYSLFLSSDHSATFEDVYRHMDHFLLLGGGDHVALGGDLDGCDSFPREFAGLKDYEKLASYLEQRGFLKDTIQNIFSNTIKEVLKVCTM